MINEARFKIFLRVIKQVVYLGYHIITIFVASMHRNFTDSVGLEWRFRWKMDFIAIPHLPVKNKTFREQLCLHV